jgi:putative drug exporter of the RND superfamily
MVILARWCAAHRWVVLAAWCAALVVSAVAARVAGSDYMNGFSLPGTGSSQAVSLLQSVSPAVAGDTEQVVIEAAGPALVTDPAVAARVRAMLSRVAHVPGVTRVGSPYGPSGGGQVSPDHRVTFATVTFARPASDIPAATGNQLITAARSGDGPGISVAVTGQVAEAAELPSPAIGTALGIVAAGAVLAVVFGSLTAMALPLLTALVSLGISVSAVELLSHVVGIPSVAADFILLIGLGVAIDYCLFIVSSCRRGLLSGQDTTPAIVSAVLTSGRAVLFAGTIVCIALLGMLVLGIGFFTGLAIATAIAVALTMVAALTLLPALLAVLGPRVLSRRQRSRLVSGQESRQSPAGGPWERWAGIVTRRPVLPALAALAVIVIVAVPCLSLRLGSADQGTDPPSTTTRQAYDMLVRGFGPGYPGPLQLVAEVRGPAQRAALRRVETAVRGQPGVASTAPPVLLPAAGGTVALVTAYPATSPQAAATTALLQRLRARVIPGAAAGSGLRVYIGGTTATLADFAHVISARLAWFITAIVALSLAVLVLVFRSLLIPLTAAIMNLLSAGAAYGVVVAVFQWSWAGGPLGVAQPVPVESFIPLLMFAILFGLSMDYQVFLLTRIHEAWLQTRDNARAIRAGLSASGGIITAAALIMILVFGSFIASGTLVTKEFGLGLAAAVLIDAVVVRAALVPALMRLLGPANWWIPRWLSRALPRLAIEAPETATRRPGPGTAVTTAPSATERN